MTAVRIDQFSGMRPRVEPRLLNNNESQTARDCDLYAGVIRPIYANLFQQFPGVASGECSTMYITPYYDQMLAFGNLYSGEEHHRDVVRSPIANNAFERVYISGESFSDTVMGWTSSSLYGTGNSKSYPNPTFNYPVDVPRPTSAPTLTLTLGSPSDPDNVEDRTYVTTFVTSWNNIEAESAPSDPSAAISVTPGDEVNVECVVTSPPHSGNYMPGSDVDAYWKLRVYRTVTGIGGAEYQFVGEVTNWFSVSNNYLDSALASELGEALSTAHFTPPDDDLYNLTAMPNGIMAANVKNTNQLFFSEPYQPHTYPLSYSLSTEDDIVAIGAFGDSLCVGTKGAPYVVTGIHPAAMSMVKLELAQACVSKKSMVDMGPFVIYASPEGLVAVGPGMAKVITDHLFTTTEWKDYAPETITATRWEDKYIAFYDNTATGGSLNGGFIFDPSDENAQFVLLSESDVKGAYTHAETGNIWLSTMDSSDNNYIAQWNVNPNDPKFTTNLFPSLATPANFDVELPVASIAGGTWTSSSGVIGTLQWNDDDAMDWGTAYYIEFVIDSNTCTDTMNFEFRCGMDWYDIPVGIGETGTVQMPLTVVDNHMMNFDEISPMTPDKAMQLYRGNSEGDGTIVISSVTVYPMTPGQYDATAAAAPDYLWKSKVFSTKKPICPAGAQIMGDQTESDPIKFTLWADGVKVFEKESITDSRPFRLPAGYLGEEFEVQFEGRAEIRNFAMATTMRELAQV